MVTQRPLEALFMVRIHVGQPIILHRLLVHLRFTRAAIIWVSGRVLLILGSSAPFQPDQKDADVRWRDPGNASRLTDGSRTDFGELLARLQPKTGHG